MKIHREPHHHSNEPALDTENWFSVKSLHAKDPHSKEMPMNTASDILRDREPETRQATEICGLAILDGFLSELSDRSRRRSMRNFPLVQSLSIFRFGCQS